MSNSLSRFAGEGVIFWKWSAVVAKQNVLTRSKKVKAEACVSHQQWAEAKALYITFDAEIIVACGILFQRTALHFHFVRRLPSADNNFTHPAHGLRI